jgi:hypothetical protein
MSNKKSRSSKFKSNKGTGKEGKTAKQKEPYDRGEGPQNFGKEREIHEEIVARHYEGGASPTPEAYARALKQWQQLPGSIVRPPTDVRPPAKEKPKSPDASRVSTVTADDASDEKH